MDELDRRVIDIVGMFRLILVFYLFVFISNAPNAHVQKTLLRNLRSLIR